MRLSSVPHVYLPADVFICITLLTTCFIISVSGHGRLVEPPSRSSMWRFGFKTKPNYNDHELFCGGYTVQWKSNGGKCGICGDPYHLPQPRPNEAGGVYGRGIIVRTYKAGQVIRSRVELTANHKGYFEFKLCPHNNPKVIATQGCLDQYPLQLADGSGTKHYVGGGTGAHDVNLRLPPGLTCSQCVFQWTYTAGNNWGTCQDGTGKVGCGPQETFRGCADVAIGGQRSYAPPVEDGTPQVVKPPVTSVPTRKPLPPKSRPRPSRPSRPRRPTIKPYVQPNRPVYTRKPSTKRPPPVWFSRPYTKAPSTKKPSMKPKVPNKKPAAHPGIHCEGAGAWANVAGMANWCDANCRRGYCPASHCHCVPV